MSSSEPETPNRLKYEANAWRATDEVVRAIGRETVKGAEAYLKTGLGDEADRLAIASSTESYYKSLDEGMRPEVSHPGQTRVSYSMSKAMDDNERRVVANQYIQTPTLPSETT